MSSPCTISKDAIFNFVTVVWHWIEERDTTFQRVKSILPKLKTCLKEFERCIARPKFVVHLHPYGAEYIDWLLEVCDILDKYVREYEGKIDPLEPIPELEKMKDVFFDRLTEAYIEILRELVIGLTTSEIKPVT